MSKRLMLLFALLIFSSLVYSDETKKNPMLEFLNESRSHILKLDDQKNNIKGIEVVLVKGLPDDIASKWGHSLLRFIDDDNDPYNDIVVSFSAVYDKTKEYSRLKALTNVYDVAPDTLTLGAFIKRYSLQSQRGLEYFPLIASLEQIQNIINTLTDWIDNPNLFGKYNFVSNNCFGVLKDLLSDNGFKYFLEGSVKPSEQRHWLEANLFSILPSYTSSDPEIVLKKFFRVLKVKKVENTFVYPANSFEVLIDIFDNDELLFIFQQHDLALPESLLSKLASHLRKTGSTQYTFFNKIPRSLYQTCSDQECARDYLVHLQGHIGVAKFNKWQEEMRKRLRKSLAQKNRRMKNINREFKLYEKLLVFEEDNKQLSHFKFLLKALDEVKKTEKESKPDPV